MHCPFCTQYFIFSLQAIAAYIMLVFLFILICITCFDSFIHLLQQTLLILQYLILCSLQSCNFCIYSCSLFLSSSCNISFSSLIIIKYSIYLSLLCIMIVICYSTLSFSDFIYNFNLQVLAFHSTLVIFFFHSNIEYLDRFILQYFVFLRSQF